MSDLSFNVEFANSSLAVADSSSSPIDLSFEVTFSNRSMEIDDVSDSSLEQFTIAFGKCFKGDKGDNAPLLKIQYSADGSTGWHDSPQSTDYYLRTSNDNGVTWGGAALFRGSDATDKTYVYEQGAAASVWNITHNLGKYPSVTIVDSSGDEVVGSVRHTDANSLSITFTAAFKGKAFLN